MKVLVIGGGQAAASFIAKFNSIAGEGSEHKITLLCEERELPYQRPPLSKKYATGEMSKDQLLLRPENWYSDNGVDVRLNTEVASINPASKTVTLTDGENVEWDKLVLATGSRARNLPTSVTQDLANIHTLRTLADTDGFADLIVPDNHILIVGGGYIGLEAAAVCASKGMKVTLIEAAERILQRVACPETSAWFKQAHETRGVTIMESVGLESFEGDDGKVARAKLADGQILDIDSALIGIGIIPNAELASEAGLDVDGGILVNEFSQTSDPDIYAAGDCAAFQFKNELTRLESVQNAIDQAENAAINMLGEQSPYKPYPWFWSDQFDIKLQIAGLNRGYDQVVVREGEREGGISHFYFRKGEFIAVDSMNDPRTYMVGKRILEAGKSITPDQAADRSIQLKTLM